MSDDTIEAPVDAPVVEGAEAPEVDTEETPVVETPAVKEDDDEEETVAPEAGAMPAEDGDKSDAL